MNTLVVYDSQYGNTEQVARKIASHCEALGPVQTASVRSSAQIDLAGVDLLLIGGPTQGHGMSQPLRAWLDGVPAKSLQAMTVATFDTRLRWPMFLSGSAARAAAKRLERDGARLIVPPESFLVAGSEGPLVDAELDRADAWAETLAAKLKESGVAKPEPAATAR